MSKVWLLPAIGAAGSLGVNKNLVINTAAPAPAPAQSVANVSDLDDYKNVAETSIYFADDKADLDGAARQELDQVMIGGAIYNKNRRPIKLVHDTLSGNFATTSDADVFGAFTGSRDEKEHKH